MNNINIKLKKVRKQCALISKKLLVMHITLAYHIENDACYKVIEHLQEAAFNLGDTMKIIDETIAKKEED